jgi:plasmid stabilization system protein ParE
VTPIRWSPQAVRDVEAIRDYIAQDSQRYAQLTVDRHIASVERLRAFPQSGRVVPERADPEIREVIVGPFRVVYGFEIFAREWDGAILEEVTFGESGHLLSSYFLAQAEVNQLPDPFDSAESKRFERAFTAAFVVRSASRMPEMPAGPLASFCATEWGTDASGMHEGLAAAHHFLNQGLARATATEPIVFIIA